MPPAHPSADTIIAVSSPPGRAHRGLIRLSGSDTPDILAQLIVEPADTLKPRTLTTVHLRDPDAPALLTYFAAPHSYTGQDTAELQVPGHPALLERILHQALNAGARLAEPGEFTFRAFLAGKLDLTQAEGIAATINATSDTQLKAAKHLLDGELGAFARSLVDDLGNHLALVEAGIDFTDQEDVVPIAPGTLDDHLADLQSRLQHTLTNSRSWSEVEALPWVVLVGAPSAGKSTLFNALLGRERAVIDPVPGTTRDVLSEPMKLTTDDGTERELILVDIAGLDEDNPALTTPIDAQAMAAANAAIQRADLLLNVIDPTQPTSPAPRSTSKTPALTVYTKSDLSEDQTNDGLHVSVQFNQGIDALRHAIGRQLGDLAVSVNAEMLALQPRHESNLRSALDRINDARDQLADQRDAHAIDDVELIAGCLRQALDDLAALGGQLSPDDVIGRVFATFCVGK